MVFQTSLDIITSCVCASKNLLKGKHVILSVIQNPYIVEKDQFTLSDDERSISWICDHVIQATIIFILSIVFIKEILSSHLGNDPDNF